MAHFSSVNDDYLKPWKNLNWRQTKSSLKIDWKVI